MCRKLAQKAGFFVAKMRNILNKRNKKTWTMWDRKFLKTILLTSGKRFKLNNNNKHQRNIFEEYFLQKSFVCWTAWDKKTKRILFEASEKIGHFKGKRAKSPICKAFGVEGPSWWGGAVAGKKTLELPLAF